MTKVDDNREYVQLAYDGTNPAPLKVDPVTGRLLIAINVIEEPETVEVNTDKIDENKEGLALGVTSENEPIPLHIDNRNDCLFVDLVVEGD
jgi:hypothetical protein